MLKFAPLIRVSTEKQEEQGSSLETQKSQITEAVKSLGGKIVTWTYCGQEHSTPNDEYERQLFNQMLKDSSKGIFNAVIITDPSRFSRDQVANEEGLKILKDNGIRFYVLTHEYNLNDLDNRLFLSMNAVFNQYQAQLQAEKSLKNKLERAKKGIPTAGKLPYGRTYKDGWGIDEEKKKIVEYVAESYLSGEKSILQLSKELGMNHGNLWTILKDRTGSSWVINFKGEKVTLNVPRLLPENIIEAIKKKAKHNKRFNRVKKHNYLLSGYIKCKKCGYTLTCQTNHSGKSYCKSYYHHPIERKKKCDNFRFLHCKDIDKAVLVHLFSTFGDVKRIEEAIRKATPDMEEIKKLKEQISNHDKTLSQINRKKDNIVDSIADGVIDKDDAKSKMTKLKEQESIITLEREKIITKLSSIPSDKKVEEDAKLYKRFIRNMCSTPKALSKMDFERKRKLVEYFFNLSDNSGVYIDQVDGRLEYEIKGILPDIWGILPMCEGEEQYYLTGHTDYECMPRKHKPYKTSDSASGTGLCCRGIKCSRTLCGSSRFMLGG